MCVLKMSKWILLLLLWSELISVQNNINLKLMSIDVGANNFIHILTKTITDVDIRAKNNLRLEFEYVLYSQRGQCRFLIFSWTHLMCLFNFSFFLKVFAHWLQLCSSSGFPEQFFLKWVAKCLTDFPHSWFVGVSNYILLNPR